jgi:hypothetical protein
MLEQRLVLSSTDLNFQVPTAVANMDVQVGIYSNKDNHYLDPGSPGAYQPIPNQPTLPLFDLTLLAHGGNNKAYSQHVQATVTLPNAAFNSGALVMFVGKVSTGLVISPDGSTGYTVGTPTPTSNANDTYSICEISYDGGESSNSYDVDFPYTLTTSTDTSITPFPLTQVGITQDKTTLLTHFTSATNGTPFAQCAAWHIGASAQRLTAPQDVLQGEDVIQSSHPIQIQRATVGTGGNGSLKPGASYYYIVTAYSAHTIGDSKIHGETLPSSAVASGVIPSDYTTASVALSWSAYPSPMTAGYNIYPGIVTLGQAPTTFDLIDAVDASKTSYTDTGASPRTPQQTISPATASNYGFNPLSDYITTSIQQFFDYYRDYDFVLDIPTDGTEWVGRTTTFTPEPGGSGPSYTVLRMTNIADNQQQVNIYEPFFSLNTRLVSQDGKNPPSMPTWMSTPANQGGQGVSPYESPGEMVFACNGVFATASKELDKTFDPDAK